MKSRIALLCAFSFPLGMVSSASAAAKFTKKETEIQATQTLLTKPAQAKKDEKKKPEITQDDIFGGQSQALQQINDAAIRKMGQLIRATDDTDPDKPDLMFRLADMYEEERRFYNFKARELDGKIFDAQNKNDTASVAALKRQQDDFQKKENQWLLAAVKQYIEVADHPEKFASYKKMDEVLFYLAFLLTQVKKDEAARKYFKRLIKDYPSSKFLADAYLSFGEYYFENKDLENALKLYDKVLAYPQSRVYGYAVYKEGWVYYNLQDFKNAMQKFIDVIELAAKPNAVKINKSYGQLAKEAKKDIVRTYARLPGANPEKAWPFFQKYGGDYAPTMMELLGEIYNGQGMFAESIKVYRQLMTLMPKSAKVCTWQTEVMRNTLSMTGSRATPETVKELQRLAALYEKYKDNKDMKPEALDECRDNTANTLRELATVWHKEAQRTNDAHTYEMAQYLYKEYISKFPKQQDVYQMTYFYGELLFTLGSKGENQKFCEAAPIYTDVVKMKPDPSSKYLKDAAYAAVLSWKNCLDIDDTGDDAAKARAQKSKEIVEAKKKGAKKKGDEQAPEEDLVEKKIPEKAMKMIDAFDTYIKYVPDSKELVNIKYRKARIYYEANHLDEAGPLFKDIVDHHKDSQLLVYAANLYLDCLIIKKNYKDLEPVLDEWLKRPELMADEATKTRVTSTKAGLERKRIEECEKNSGARKNFKECGQLYMDLAQTHPDDKKIDEVYYNAAILFEKANLIGAAIGAREILLKVKPDSEFAKKAVFQIGRNFQAIGVYDKAAERYEKFAKDYPGEFRKASDPAYTPDAPTALSSATFFRRGHGENDLALKDASEFVKNYGGRKEYIDRAAGIAFSNYEIYEQLKDNDKIRKHFLDYLKQWGAKGGVDRQIIAHVRIAELLWKESCPVAGVNGACVVLTRVRSAGAARVAAEQAKKQRADFKKNKKSKGKKKGAELPKQCGPETKSKVIVQDRKSNVVKEAMAHFAEALKLFGGGKAEKGVPGKDEFERGARVTDMTYYAAEARMAQGDQEYEKLLNIKIPDKLDFTPAKSDFSPAKKKAQEKKVADSKKAFGAYLENKGKGIKNTSAIYQNVILFKNAHWAIAASARIGQMYQDFSGQLFTAPIPKAPSAPQGYPQEEWDQYFFDAYCDGMVDAAEPLETKAIEGLSTCLNKSTDLSWFNEWSALCEGELNQIKPAEYPLASEIRAEPGYSTVSSDITQVQSIE